MMKSKFILIGVGIMSSLLIGCGDNKSVSYYEKNPEEARAVYKACLKTKELNGQSLSDKQCENATQAMRKILNAEVVKTDLKRNSSKGYSIEVIQKENSTSN